LKVEKGKLKAGFALSVEPSKPATALSKLAAPLGTLTIEHEYSERTGVEGKEKVTTPGRGFQKYTADFSSWVDRS